MSFETKYTTSVHGRRLGLQRMTTPETGGSHGSKDFLVGPEALRANCTTAETTSTNLKAYGVSVVPGTSAGSSAVYTIDPPIPGVMKTVIGGTENGPTIVKTANSETIGTSMGSSWTTVEISSFGGVFQMIGVTTARWAAVGLTTGTSSQASGFILTTST